MAGLAVLLKAQGHEVTGCDVRASARTRWLEGLGIPVALGHDTAHLAGVDMTVVTSAVPAGEPEFAHAPNRRFRGEVLAGIVNDSDAVAVCGSHGKTTTATWIAKLLLALGEDVAWCIGGETGDFPVAHAAAGPLVVEADESDGTLAFYHAKTLVVTNCEYDHPDHFKSVADYRACYDAARRQAADVIEGEALPPLAELEPALRGLAAHNRRNARAAVEVARRRGHPLAKIVAALPDVVMRLPDRRFQKLAPDVYTDYAHHPTEMACAIDMARQICRGKLRVIFQPHRYSRTRALLSDFPRCFAAADETILCPTYAAFEQPVEGGDVADLYRACREAGVRSLRLARSCEEAWTHSRRTSAADDLTLVLGAGDIISKLNGLPPRRIWIGHGSNTWKTDLDIGEEYVSTTGPANEPGASLRIPWMAGVPGTIGGWLKMNAGAFGHSISELVAQVRVDGVWLPREQCGFAYRRSALTGEIQDVRFNERLEREQASKEDFLSRRPHFPPGTFGSFFKNPDGDSAGRLLDMAGAKTLRVGGCSVWSEHANVIVRGPNATPGDVLALARLMRNRVFFRFGIALEPEVCGIVF